MMLGKQDSYIKENEIKTLPNTIHNNKLKIDKKRPEYKTRSYKTLRGKHRWNLWWHKSKKIWYDPPPRVMQIKMKLNKWDLIKLKSLCTVKETINKVKRTKLEWEKTIANETSDKRLISKIHKQLIQHKNKEPIQKWGKNLNTFLQRRHTDD